MGRVSWKPQWLEKISLFAAGPAIPLLTYTKAASCQGSVCYLFEQVQESWALGDDHTLPAPSTARVLLLLELAQQLGQQADQQDQQHWPATHPQLALCTAHPAHYGAIWSAWRSLTVQNFVTNWSLFEEAIIE